MEVDLKCNYCGLRVIKNITSKDQALSLLTCSHCGDKDVSARQIDPRNKIDYYQGSPAFEEKKKEEPKPEVETKKIEKNDYDFENYPDPYDDYFFD